MKTFENITSLKLATLKEGQFVETGGYYSKGDGGGARYLIATPQAADEYGDHTLANGNVAVLQSDVVSVRRYGAKGDGVTDDSAAIQAAIDSLVGTGGSVGEVVFPYSGGEVYSISSTLVVSATRTTLKGLGNPDKRTGAGAESNSILWNGPSGGTMLSIVDPLDVAIDSIGFNGNDIADYGIDIANSSDGQGGGLFDRVSVEKCNKNLLKQSGAVDAGRNRWTRCTFRKTNPNTLSEIDDAVIAYVGSDNVFDRYIECEILHASTGAAEPNSVGIYVSFGSPDVYLDNCFLKADTALVQSDDGTGIAYWNATNCYVEGPNFFRSDKSGLQRQDFINVRHVGVGGNSINVIGNTNAAPMTLLNCDFAGDILVTGRDDFPLTLINTNYNALALDGDLGDYTNLVQIGRVTGSANTSSSAVNSQGYCTAMASPTTAINLNTGLQSGSVFRVERVGGASITIKNPTAVTPLDQGRVIELWMTNTGASPNTLTWESDYKGASLPTEVAGGTTTIMQFRYNGAEWFEISRVEGIA